MALLQKIRNSYLERRLTKIVKPHTLVGPERIHNLFVLAQRIEAERIPGDVLECGVCNGGTAALLARFATRSRLNRTVWLLDSFQGMPPTTEKDGPAPDGRPAEAHIGKEVGDLSRVKTLLYRVGAKSERICILPGWFQDTFPSVSASQIALLNIDADWYESVKLCLETFYDRVSPGGFISLDDYGHWPGCRRAVDEFFEARRLTYTLNKVDYTAHWFRKE
jgi:Macrocin-O-methyltransferase (TylF)